MATASGRLQWRQEGKLKAKPGESGRRRLSPRQPRAKATTKAKTTSKKTARKVSPRLASPKKAEPTGKTAVKPAPVSALAQPAAARPMPGRPAQLASLEQRIGVVTHYYSHLSVATIRLEPGATQHVGDVIHRCGHTTDFTQRVESLDVDHAPVTEVGPNDDFGLKVIEHAREHDAVFKVRS